MKKPDLLPFVLIVKHTSPMESDLELPYVQNHSTFAIAEYRTFESFVCKLGIAAAWAVYDLQSCKRNTILR